MTRKLEGTGWLAGKCSVPPEGWTCSRAPGHTGPCAAKSKSVAQEYEESLVHIGRDPDRDKITLPPDLTNTNVSNSGEFSPTVPRWPGEHTQKFWGNTRAPGAMWVGDSPPTEAQVIAANPKSRDSSHKIPLSLCPASVRIAIARVFKLGGEKPGRYHWNWREEPISVTQYIDAIHRHLARFEDGEEFDEEMSEQAGQPVAHLDIIASNIAMMIDAREAGTLVNDLPKVKGGAPAFLKRIMGKK